MESEVFFERYKIRRDAEDKPEEIGRTGAAIVYKAVDEQSNEPVLLQLVPLSSIDQTLPEEFQARAKAVCQIDHVNVARVFAAGIQNGYFAFVTERLIGETADAWVVAHGPLPPDAALRIGLQVVRATAAAAFHGLTHRAIQPSNIIILNGESPSGGWPFIKLLNFGLAALELHHESTEARDLAPAVVPQFASPEQVLDRPIDFRSEMYSLGATLCFLLTGAVPLPRNDPANLKRRGPRRLPQLKSMPKPLRSLLSTMLAENPDYRPVDPVALERDMAMARKLGLPLAADVQKKIMRSPSPIAQVLRGGLVVAALLIAVAAIGVVVYPRVFHHRRSVEEVGVPIGVPVAESTNVAPPAQIHSSAKIRSAKESSAVAQPSPSGLPLASKERKPATTLATSSGPPGPAPTSPPVWSASIHRNRIPHRILLHQLHQRLSMLAAPQLTRRLLRMRLTTQLMPPRSRGQRHHRR